MTSRRRTSRGTWFRQADDAGLQRRLVLAKALSAHEIDALGTWHWEIWGRDEQLAPEGDWRVWMICAGRGFGKTRAGAEWVRGVARADPTARIALVAASLPEARAVMVEGESGILAASPGALAPEFEPSLRRLTWPNGAQAYLYSAAEPETLRGPQHSHAWCDEVAKWENAGNRAMAAWDNLQLGMRLGDHPRVLATSTPRRTPLMVRLEAEAATGGGVIVARGRTVDNAGALPPSYYASMLEQFGGIALGRQELDGEMLDETEGALWSRTLLDRCREHAPRVLRVRTVVGVDPPAGEKGDACGIVVAALLEDGTAVVLADASVEKAGPERWARAVAAAAQAWQADRVVAEANNGGSMVKSVLRAADEVMPVRLVHASNGKVARAEPVAALYEAGKVRHAGVFAALEAQMCGLLAAGGYEGPGRSPDRADALVWALTELMLGKKVGPRIRLPV